MSTIYSGHEIKSITEEENKMGVIIGLDIGVASVGWAVVDKESYKVLETGANLFTSADASQNAKRRDFRQKKRLSRREHTRIKDFEKLWEKNGYVIPRKFNNNVLELRVKGLNEKLGAEELFWVLKNLLKHRGISYLEEALDETNIGKSDYENGILKNEKELEKGQFPCEIQLKRLNTYGCYRGNVVITEDGEKITLSNIYTTSAYRKEAEQILETQIKEGLDITEDFVNQYLQIFSRKRKYYEGPGSEKSRTDYGKYPTRIDPETGDYVEEDNIFEKLIGKCSVRPDLMRAAGATYTAQEFNVLNDLNNLMVNGRKLEETEKIEIVKEMKKATSVNVEKIIQRVIGQDIVSLTGVRLDKNDKPEFHRFEQYRMLKKEFAKQDIDIEKFPIEDLDKIGNVLTLNTDKEGILQGFHRQGLILSEEEKECLILFRKKNGSLFSKWQSFSLEVMQELIPDMYEQPKNQMELLTEKKMFQSNLDKFKDCVRIPKESITENIYNPVVCRSIRITVDIINALIKKYKQIDQIVVEMPRDRNEDEEKKRITKADKDNAKELEGIIKKVKEEYGITITDEDFKGHKKLALKLKLWNEQEGKCLYSNEPIEISDLLHNPELFEIDHIIPISISFDDSRSNKVLTFRTENKDKGNMTPLMYLQRVTRDWDFDEFMSCVLELKGKKRIPKAKADKLLESRDITKVEVLKGFIARNINDTRYASRVVLNTLQNYFKAKEAGTKVKVIRGSFTHQMRDALHLKKDRESYAHHAVDAMLVCYSQMGFEAYHKLQSEFIDFEKETILDKKAWEQQMDSEIYKEVMYQNKWLTIRSNILEAEKKVRYWHKVDKKPNRGLCKQTIYGTRKINGKTMKIRKIDIYSKDGWNTLKKILDDGKEERFLMYKNDPRTWEDMLKIIEAYRDAKNPFVEYERETGDYLRKYSKKHNGPRIVHLKYTYEEVGSCIDISHKYGFAQGSQKVILEDLNPFRADVYYNQQDAKYYIVGIKYSDLMYDKGRCVINEEAYNRILVQEKMISASDSRLDLERLGYEFCFSLYKDDFIEFEKNGEYFTERFHSRTMTNRNYILVKPIDAKEYKNGKVGLAKTKSIKKIRVDILGNRYYCTKEKFVKEVDIKG